MCRVGLCAVFLSGGTISVARAQPLLQVSGCPDDTEAALNELVALETAAPIDVSVRCTDSSIRVTIRHRQSSGVRDIESVLDTSAESLRNLALQIAEAAELAASDEPDPVEDEPDPPDVSAPVTTPFRNFVDASLMVGMDGRPEFRGGAELGARFGKTFGVRILARVLAGPEPGDAIDSVWIAAGGLGPHVSFGDGFLRGEVSLLGLLGAAFALPGQATTGAESLWFAGVARGGVVLGGGAIAFAALLEAGVQRRLDQRVLDAEGRVVLELEGSVFIGALWLSLRFRLGEGSAATP